LNVTLRNPKKKQGKGQGKKSIAGGGQTNGDSHTGPRGVLDKDQKMFWKDVRRRTYEMGVPAEKERWPRDHGSSETEKKKVGKDCV